MESGMRIVREFKGIKPLYDYGNFFIGWSKGTIYRCENDGTLITIGKLPMKKYQYWLCRIRILERVLRLFPRWGMAVNTDVILVSFHGAIYRVNLASGEIFCEHTYVKGMNNSLMVGKIKGLNGFEDGFSSGEYTGKRQNSKVAIWMRGSGVDASWRCVYRFEANQITHIHALIPDYYRDGLLILTGDEDDESGIWLAHDHFASVKPLIRGKQESRACMAVPCEKGILYATDTPLEKNGLFFLCEENGKWFSHKKYEMPGPTIYGVFDEEFLFISNSVEADSRMQGLKYLFSRKLGAGVEDEFVRIYSLNLKTLEMQELARYKKDIFPPALGQFGTVMFADRERGVRRVLAYPMAVKKCDNMTVEILKEQEVK